MRKFLLLLTTLFTLSAAYAQDPVVSITTVKANQGTSVNQYTQTTNKALVNPNDATQSWTTYGFSNNNKGWDNIRCGNKNAGTNGYTATLKTDFAVSASINKVSIELARFQTGANDKITSIKLLVADDAGMTNATTAAEITDLSAFLALTKSTNSTMGTTCTYDFNIENPAPNKYYQLAFELPKTTNNGIAALLKIDYYGEVVSGAVAAPVISLNDDNMVSISQEDNADIYYTTDGTAPTTASAKYKVPFAITGKTTVKAIAVLGGKESRVTTSELKPNIVANLGEFIELANTNDTKVNTPLTAIYQCGRNLYLTDGNDFILAYNSGNVADVTNLAAQNGDVVSFITGSYKSQNGLPELIPSAIGTKSAGTPVEAEELAIEDIGTDMLNKYVKIVDVNIVAASSANNYTANDGTGDIIIYNTFANATYYPNAITLPDGTTGNTVPEGEGFTVYGFVSCYGTTLQITPIKIEGGQVMETVATPVFTPASGSALKVGDEITIACETEGATIYIAFDGEEPTTESMEYTGALSFSEGCTIKAIAVKEGMLDSDIATATYTLFVAGAQTATFNFGDANELVCPEGIKPPETVSTAAESAYFADKDGKEVTFTSGGVNLTFATSADNATNTYPQWWLASKGLELRVYGGNSMTFSAGESKISKITFTKGCSSTSWNWPTEGNLTVDPADGTMSDVDGAKVWTAPEGGVSLAKFDFNGKGRIGTITVEYIADEVQGIDEIGSDNNDAPVEYYNLQGIRVNGDNLTPGIYVRRQGCQVAKVLVK